MISIFPGPHSPVSQETRPAASPAARAQKKEKGSKSFYGQLNGWGCIPVQRPRRLFQWRIFWSWSTTTTLKRISSWLIRSFRCIISTCAVRPGAGTSMTASLSRAPPGCRRSWTITTQQQKRRCTSRVRWYIHDSQSAQSVSPLLMGGEV